MTSLIMMMISALMAMALYTLSERKLLGYMQYRKGPNKPSMMAMATPVADATKLLTKNKKIPLTSNMKYHLLAPMMMIILSLLLWPIAPNNNSSFFMKFTILYFLCITSINIYTTFMTGWSSNSKWSLLGALRSIAQTISYEVSMSLILIILILHPASMKLPTILRDQYSWTMLLLTPLATAWIISILAETHRTPFDFTEGESELVSGFNIEYSSSPFALIFMAEYMNILLMSIFTTTILSKSYSNPELIMKSTAFSFMFIWMRGALPRLRYDTLMSTLWKKIMPASLMLMLLITPMTTMMKWYCTDKRMTLMTLYTWSSTQYLPSMFTKHMVLEKLQQTPTSMCLMPWCPSVNHI